MDSFADLDPRDLLAWYVTMGVDIAVGEESLDRTKRTDRPMPLLAPEAGKPAPMAATPALFNASPDAVALAARATAAKAATLEDLRVALDSFDGCALKQTASRLVFGDGTPGAKVMFIGEAPGRDEDLQGIPFVGKSGQLLDRMLNAIGLARADVYIANIVPWRPPGNRTPTPQEAAICRPFLQRQIELVDPQILICLGAPSAQAMLGISDGILKARGRWLSYDLGTRVVRAMATLHPAYLLRQPVQKRYVWRDFRAIRKALAAPL